MDIHINLNIFYTYIQTYIQANEYVYIKEKYWQSILGYQNNIVYTSYGSIKFYKLISHYSIDQHSTLYLKLNSRLQNCSSLFIFGCIGEVLKYIGKYLSAFKILKNRISNRSVKHVSRKYLISTGIFIHTLHTRHVIWSIQTS